MSGYAQGVRVEHAVVHHLTDNGYDCQRAARAKIPDQIGVFPWRALD